MLPNLAAWRAAANKINKLAFNTICL